MKLSEENDILWGYTSLIVKSLAKILPNSQAYLKASLLSSFSTVSDVGIKHMQGTREDGVREEDPKAILIGSKGVLENFKRIRQYREIAIKNASSDELGSFIDLLDQSIEILTSLIRQQKSNGIRGIYVIVDPQATKGRDPYKMAEKVIKGGVKVIQYRDKKKEKSSVMQECYRLAELCNKHNVTFVVNDSAEIARFVDADFLHVGQNDIPVGLCRTVLDDHQCIGKSNDGVAEAMESEKHGVDYLAVGAVYNTDTMGKSHRVPVGTKGLIKVKESTSLPIVAIGGINEGNLREVKSTGVDSVCIVSAITMAEDPEVAASKLVSIWDS
jgi:thiamine-phosphate pyrophosphorylase